MAVCTHPSLNLFGQPLIHPRQHLVLVSELMSTLVSSIWSNPLTLVSELMSIWSTHPSLSELERQHLVHPPTHSPLCERQTYLPLSLSLAFGPSLVSELKRGRICLSCNSTVILTGQRYDKGYGKHGDGGLSTA